MQRLSREAILQSIPKNWELQDNALVRSFVCTSYREAAACIAKVVEAAESINHHPDIQWTYTRVVFHLSTHDAGGITEKDIQLAETIEHCFAAEPAPSMR